MAKAGCPVPANQLLGGEAERHDRKLQVEPVRLEPEKQVDAEDDWNGAETEGVDVAPRPGEQHVEGIREQQLRGDEVGRLVDLRPVPAPVEQHRALGTGLHVVLLPRNDLERQRAGATPRACGERGVPCAKRERSAHKREQEPGIRADGSEQRQAGQRARERQRERERVTAGHRGGAAAAYFTAFAAAARSSMRAPTRMPVMP